MTAGHAADAPGGNQELLCSPKTPLQGMAWHPSVPVRGGQGPGLHHSLVSLSSPRRPSHPKDVLPEPLGAHAAPSSALSLNPGQHCFKERPGCRLAAVGGLMSAWGYLTLHVPPRRFVRVPLAPLPAASCPAGAARCQSSPAGAHCQMHKEGLSATGNTEGVDFRPGKWGHKGPGPGRGMRGCAPAPCQWRLCSEYKGRRGSGASGAVKGSRARGAPWGPCSLASPLLHPKCCLCPRWTPALTRFKGLSQMVPERCWRSSVVATGFPHPPEMQSACVRPPCAAKAVPLCKAACTFLQQKSSEAPGSQPPFP